MFDKLPLKFVLLVHSTTTLGNVVIMRVFFICHKWQKPKITQILIYTVGVLLKVTHPLSSSSNLSHAPRHPEISVIAWAFDSEKSSQSNVIVIMRVSAVPTCGDDKSFKYSDNSSEYSFPLIVATSRSRKSSAKTLLFYRNNDMRFMGEGDG